MRFIVKNLLICLIIIVLCFGFFLMLSVRRTIIYTKGLQPRSFQDQHNQITQNRFCHFKHNFVFLKVHKAGSSTVTNILQRFGLRHNLTFVLPRSGHLLGKTTTLFKENVLPLKPNDTYNILCSHVIYNKEAFRKVLKKRMFYFAILRSPFEQFVSAFYYYTRVYRNKYLLNVPSDNPIRQYLLSPDKYESFLENRRNSYTDNRMALDLGLDVSLFRNKRNISEYIKVLEKDFHFIMILEYFDISMVLLKRYLCWDLRDILYIPKNMLMSKKEYNIDMEDLNRHREWAMADYMIYEHFLGVFWKKVLEEGPDLLQEVQHYKMLLMLTKSFCSARNSTSVVIPKSVWNDRFILNGKDCDQIRMGEIRFTALLQKRHKTEFTKPVVKGTN